MTIKKNKMAGEPAALPAVGGATIADRFKLDMPDPNAKKASSGKGTVFAVIAGVLALGVAGVLLFVIWNHWQFLANA